MTGPARASSPAETCPVVSFCMLRRDEICGDLGAMMHDCRLQGRSNKSLISLTGARGANPLPARRLRRRFKNLARCASGTVKAQREANRILGFVGCLYDVHIKSYGAHKLSGDRRLAAYKSKAKD